MARVRSATAPGILATLIATVAMALSAYLGALESLGTWIRQLEPGRLGGLLAVFVVLTVALGFYGWRARSHLQRQTTLHEREAGELEPELNTREALQWNAATYRGVIADLPVALFAVDSEGVFTLTEGTGLDLLGLEPERVVGRSIFERYRNAPQVVECVRLALGGQASDATVEVGGRAFETRYSLLREKNGEFSGVLGVAIDVTARRRAEDRLRQAEVRYRTLVEQVPAITYVEELSINGKILAYMSPQYEAVLGYSAEEGVPHPEHWTDVIHPEDRERVLAEDRRTDESLEPFRAEYRMIAKDGSVVWVRDEAVLVRGESGEPQFWQGVIFDITERKLAEEALKESEATLAEAQRLAHLGSWEWDVRSDKVRWSDETFRIYGLTPQEFVPSFDKLLEVVHPEDRKVLSKHLEAVLTAGDPYDLEHRIVRPDGEVRVVHRRAEVVRDEDGEPLKVVGTVHDITERKALEEKLEHQALHDSLTGLPNRALFMDRLGHALSRAKRRKSEVAILFMDLDNLKVINDSLGHRAGDRVLVAASKRIQSVLRPEDTVARLGGDEFILLLESIEVTEAVHATERIQQRLQVPISVSGRQLFITASVGITIGGTGKQAADLLRDADSAMYQAKRSGKARYAVFEEEMNARAIERLELEHGLRQALKRGEFRVYYQPQMQLDADLQRYLRSAGNQAVVARSATQAPRIAGMEALVRWEHPERGLLLPGDFIPLAEETSLIVDIDELVLAEACRKTKEWQAHFPAEPPLAVCVNLSARQFREPDLIETIRRILAETGLHPTCLHLEITESTAMGDAPATVATLEELNDLGVRLVIDDFGTGYSSLAYLERFPVDCVKIDRSFVGKLGKDQGTAALVSGMIRLAHSLGLKVIAEGVETEEQLKRLQGLGCDLAQGYYFSEPVPYQAVGPLLKSNAPDI